MIKNSIFKISPIIPKTNPAVANLVGRFAFCIRERQKAIALKIIPKYGAQKRIIPKNLFPPFCERWRKSLIV